MNRNAIFFIVISLHAPIALLNSSSKYAELWKNIKKGIKEAAADDTFKNNVIYDEKIDSLISEKFDNLINKNNLNEQQCITVVGLKHMCRGVIQASNSSDAHKAITFYLAKIAQAKTEYIYEKHISKDLYNKKTQEKLGQEAFEKALNKTQQNKKLTYVFNGILEKKLHQKIDSLLHEKQVKNSST